LYFRVRIIDYGVCKNFTFTYTDQEKANITHYPPLYLSIVYSFISRTGLTLQQESLDVFSFFGTMLAIPIFVAGLSQIMVIANTFVIDTWTGSKFMKTVTNWDSTLVDWLSLLVFIGFPVIIAAISLYTGTDNWWDITSISWFILVFAYYIVFMVSAVYYEVDGCLELVRYHPEFASKRNLKNSNLAANPERSEHTLETFYDALVLRLNQRLSGDKHVTYIVTGSETNPRALTHDDLIKKESFDSYTGLWTRITRLKCMSCFYEELPEPVRQFQVDDVLEFTPFVTSSSWGLEALYCRNRSTRFVAIIDGVSALTKGQVKSTLFCFLFGTTVTLFFIVGFLVWLQAGALVICIVTFLYFILVWHTTRNSLGIYAAYKKVLSREDGNIRSIVHNTPSDAMYQVQETYRVTKPKILFCCIVLVMQLIFLYIIPIVALFSAGNNRVGIVFVILGLTTAIRDVFNAPACLRELGSMDGIENNNKDKDGSLGEWREKHRLGRILSEISVGKRSNFWVGVFLVFVLAFCGIFIAAIALGSDNGVTKTMKFADRDEFLYEGSGSLNYASCSLGHNIQSPDGLDNSLADFAFLSNVAYLDDNAANIAIDEWFSSDSVENLSQDVTDFSTKYQAEFGQSPVKYKLFDFPDTKLKIVAIRGTSNPWDALTDAQLWSSAALSQYIRSILPLGELWTPILPFLVKAISVIEDKALRDVSYYRETTAFVESLKKQDVDVQITGHCKYKFLPFHSASLVGRRILTSMRFVPHCFHVALGGGLAMITGAQTQIPSVGLSGPNNLISRNTFYPPITSTNLNKYTFNIVPDRDPVPRIDDLSQNYQRIRCKASANKPVDCHFGKRSLCEILFTCGSLGRPVPCFCVNDYEYALPTSLNGGDFTSVCPKE
jgi:hypothetical protein